MAECLSCHFGMGEDDKDPRGICNRCAHEAYKNEAWSKVEKKAVEEYFSRAALAIFVNWYMPDTDHELVPCNSDDEEAAQIAFTLGRRDNTGEQYQIGYAFGVNLKERLRAFAYVKQLADLLGVDVIVVKEL